MIDSTYIYIENEIKLVLQKYLNMSDIEIEIRFGWKGSLQMFNSDIGKYFYDEIMNQLESCQEWSKKVEINSVDLHYNNIRKRDKMCIEKTLIYQKLIEMLNFPFDIRISVCSEKCVTDLDYGKETYKCEKKRRHYEYKMWAYDLSEVNVDDIYVCGDCEKKVFQFEIELMNDKLNNHNLDYLSKSLCAKIYDIFNIPRIKST